MPYRELSVDRSSEPSAVTRERVNRESARCSRSGLPSARECSRTRTIADLASTAAIGAAHVSEGVQYSSLDRPSG